MSYSLAILDNAPLGSQVQEASDTSDVIGSYLREQADLSAVEKFSQKHQDAVNPLQEPYYRDLLPISKPATGEQYAFEVDLDLCTGCKGCVTACKSLNGLGDDESWRDVGLIHGQRQASAVQHVTTACHHCLEPACASGCPVNAYVKLDESGIVKHLDDQCIGCQYCTLTCPYDVPKFSKELGIVRKCDMCVGRLEKSEAPACVQACPNEAIRITVVSHEDVWAQAQAGMVVPGTPPSDITFPTTHFKTGRAQVRELVPADYDQPQKEHGHAPLIVMLVLTQVAAGVFVTEFLSGWATGLSDVLGYWGSAVGFGICCLAMAASILHLGRPKYAYRAILGLGHSWLSREILAFGLFVKAAGLLVFIKWAGDTSAQAGLTFKSLSKFLPALESVTIFLGIAGVFCSVMVYHVTRRIFWNAARTLPKFTMTMIVGGASCLMFTACVRQFFCAGVGVAGQWVEVLAFLTSLTMLFKLGLELEVFLHARDKVNSSLKRTAVLHLDSMRGWCVARLLCALAGGFITPWALVHGVSNELMSHGSLALLAAAGFLLVLCGELSERYLFFRAVVALKMPGGIPG
jgi:formate dehydrogenase iron-sulfur subunit